MNDPANGTVEGRRCHRVVWSVIAVSALTLSAIRAFFLKVQFVNIDIFMAGTIDGVKARYLDQRFATTRDTEDYLDEATVVFSEDPGDVVRGRHALVNEVCHVRGHEIINWGDTDVVTELATGEWRITPRDQVLYWRG